MPATGKLACTQIGKINLYQSVAGSVQLVAYMERQLHTSIMREMHNSKKSLKYTLSSVLGCYVRRSHEDAY